MARKPNFTDEELRFIKMYLSPQIEKEIIAEDIINKIKNYEQEVEEEKPDFMMTIGDLIYASNDLDSDKWNLVTFDCISPINGYCIRTLEGKVYKYCYPFWDDDKKILEAKNNVLKYIKNG